MEKSDYKKLGLPAVRVVDVKGYEFAKVGTIAKWLDVSADVGGGDAGGDESDSGGESGAEAVEGFAVPDTAATTGIFSAESDTVRSHERCEFRTRVGMSVKARQYPDSGFSTRFLGQSMLL